MLGRIVILLFLLLAPALLESQVPNNPLLRLRADSGVVIEDGRVTSWSDISDHGHTATPVGIAPGFIATSDARGEPALTFDQQGHLSLPAIFPTESDYTKIAVVKLLDPDAANNVISGSTTHAFWMGRSLQPKIFHNGVFATSRATVDSGVYFLMIGSFEHARRRGVLHVNGEFAGAGITSRENLDSTLNIGAYGAGNRLTGEITEVLVYDRVLSDEERSTLEDHLLGRYGITSYRKPEPFPFRAFPAEMELIPRGEDDSAEVLIAGFIDDPIWDSIAVRVSRDGVFWKEEVQKLEHGSLSAPFVLQPTIYADTVEFGIRVELRGIDSVQVIGERTSLLCGDVLMITGQSNSIFGNAAATWQSRFARSFGSVVGYNMLEESDTIWGLSRATTGGGAFAVGAWGLELQRLILENEGIPTAVINGGVGGSRIEQNLRDEGDPENLRTIYGRTLYRARRAGVDTAARALYWYQGESNTIDDYYENFRILYASWLRDYPNLEQIYVVQIRPGCSAANPHLALRELQRTLPDSFAADPVPIVSYAPTAAPAHDGCHYGLAGYLVIAEQLYRLTARDLWGSTDTRNIASPTLVQARYGSPDNRTIELLFGPQDDDLVWQGSLLVNDELRLLRDAFLLDGESGLVASGSATGNRVTLRLSDSGTASRVTYVPDVYYPGTTTIYEGPWLMNSRGVGAFTFAGVEIAPYDPSGVEEDESDAGKILRTDLR